MKRLRAQLAGIGPAVAALFALSIAAPRVGLLHHQHPGGEQAHVHADDDGAIAELLEDYWHDHDHAHDSVHDHQHPGHHRAHLATHHPRQPAPSGAVLEDDDASTTGHTHQQDRFHRAVVAAAPFVPAVAPAGAASQYAPTLSAHVAARTLRARAPPPSPLS